MAERPVSPTEAFAMGTLHGVLKEAGFEIDYPIDVDTRMFDVTGLVPNTSEWYRPTIRITIEEVQ